MEGEDEEEVFLWNEETEDPLNTDMNDISNSSKVIVKKEPGCSELVNGIVKTEPNSNYKDETFQPSCSSASQIQDPLPDECEDNADDPDLPIRFFPCKLCKKPYRMRMVFGSNLMIRGFCDGCLYSSNKSQPNSCYDENSENVYIKCSVCNEKFIDVKKFNVHVQSLNTCETCGNKFCNANEFEKHLLMHDNLHKKKVKDSSVTDSHFNNGIEALEKHVNLFINTISDDFVEKDGLMDEEISSKVPGKPKKEKSCKKLSSKIIKNPVSDKSYPKIKCELCGKLVPKQLIRDHMDEKHSNRFLQDDQSAKSFLFESSDKEVKSDSLKVPLQKSGDGKKPYENKPDEKKPKPSKKSESVECVNELNSGPDNSSSSTLNLNKNEARLSYCKYEYVCELCHVQYNDMNVLKEHLVSDQHVNMIVTIVDLSLSCKLCKGSFSSISDLKAHLIQDLHVINYHIKKTEVSMFCCKICNKTFISESDFVTHELLEGHQVREKKKYSNSSEDKTVCPVTQEKNAACLETQETDKARPNKQKDVAICIVKQEMVVQKPIERSKERMSRTCKTCNKVFNLTGSLKRHVKRYKHRPYVAFNNLKTSSHSKTVIAPSPQEDANVEESVKNNLQSEINDHQCKNCNKVYSTYGNMRRHSIRCNKKSVAIKSDSSGASVINENRKSNNKSGVKFYDCKICSKSYENESSLKRHIKTKNHYDTSNIFPNNQLKLSSLEAEVKLENLFSCEDCHKAFDNEISLKSHCLSFGHNSGLVKNECKTDLLMCKICKSKFSCRGDLLFHYCLKRHNLNCKIRVNCVCCNKTFKRLIFYVKHANRKQHVEESLKTFAGSDNCNLCGTKCPNLYALKQHITSIHHIGTYLKHLFNKKKKCTVKDSSTTALSDISTNCNITSNKIHKCKYCNKLFNYHFLLTHHLKTHEKVIRPSKCIGCSKRFSNIYLMRKHFKSCHTEKMHACPVCEKKFTFPYQVKIHIRSHYK